MACRSRLSVAVVRVRDTSQVEVRDGLEVCRISAVQRQAVGNGAGCDQGVVGARCRFAAGRSQGGGNCAERACGLGVESEDVEV